MIGAMLIAVYTVLSTYASVSLGNIRFTFEALPVLLAAALYGPAPAVTVGALGSFLNQLLTYGLTPTTLLWILPHAAGGAVAGLMCRKGRPLILAACASALTVTLLNTLAMYVDSRMYGYYSAYYVFGALLYRLLGGIVTGMLFSQLLPPVLRRVSRAAGAGKSR